MVRQLLERVVAGDPELLTGGAEPAATVFAVGAGDMRAEEGVFASLQGLYWLVVNLAARVPLVLLADDVHWADTASLRWLVFLAERVKDVGALLVVATRPAEPGADQELLDALMVAPAVRVVRPAPLSAGATTAVVRGRLPRAVEAFGAACYRATGGNAFLLGELLGELVAAGAEGTADESGKVSEFGSEGVGRAVRARLRRLPVEATAVARAVAVLGPGSPFDEVAALANPDDVSAARVADALVGIDVLAASGALDFVHPVVRGCALPAARARGATEPSGARRRAYELGVAEATDRQRDCFDSDLREAMSVTRDPAARAEIALALGRARASFGDFRASAEVLEDALCGLDDPDGELGVALEAELLTLCLHESIRAVSCASSHSASARCRSPRVRSSATTVTIVRRALSCLANLPAASNAASPPRCRRTRPGCVDRPRRRLAHADARASASPPPRAPLADVALLERESLGSRLTSAGRG